MPEFMEIIAAYGPAISAIILILKYDGVNKLKTLLKRITIWKVDLKWYLIALFLQPIIWLTAIYIDVTFIGQSTDYEYMYFFRNFNSGNILTPYYLLFLLIYSFLSQFIVLLGEEIGWRGYMLPKLLTTKNWIYSSLLVGLVWGVWHLPLFYLGNTTQSNIPLSLYFLDLIASTFIFTWIFYQSKGSLLIATLFHTSINAATIILPILPHIAGDTKPYIIGIIIKFLCVAVLIIKYRSNIYVKHTGTEGAAISKIGKVLNMVFGFFEKIVDNMYNQDK